MQIRRTLSTLFAITLLLGVTAPTFASEPGNIDEVTARMTNGDIVPIDPTDRTEAEEIAFRNEITLLVTHDELTPDRMEDLGLTPLSPELSALPEIEEDTPTNESDLSVPSITPRALCGVRDAATSANDINVSRPQIVINTGSSGYIMYAYARYNWVNPPFSDCPHAKAQIGGADGLAISLSKGVVNKGVSFVGCNSYNLCKTSGWLETNNKYGAGWSLQDWGYAKNYGYSPTYKGTLTYSFKADPDKCIQAFAKYGHSWNKTALSGFSVGKTSVGISWTTTADKWQKSSQAGSYKC